MPTVHLGPQLGNKAAGRLDLDVGHRQAETREIRAGSHGVEVGDYPVDQRRYLGVHPAPQGEDSHQGPQRRLSSFTGISNDVSSALRFGHRLTQGARGPTGFGREVA